MISDMILFYRLCGLSIDDISELVQLPIDTIWQAYYITSIHII